MRHKIKGYKLGRSTAQRDSLRRSLVTELIDHGRIQTTEAKCKAIRDQAEKLVTIAKGGLEGEKARQVNARRLVAGQTNGGVEVVHRSPQKIMEEISALDAESAIALKKIQGLLA